MTIGGDFMPLEGQEESAEYPKLFGVSITPTVGAIGLTLLGAVAAYLLWSNLVQGTLQRNQELKADIAAKEEQLKNWANWPDFNGRSTQHVKEFLFGETLNGRTDADGKPVRLRPEEGRSLYLEPLLDTSKPPRRWHELKQKNLTKSASPGTSKMILSILAQDNPEQMDQINLLRDQRFLDQVLKSILRPPCQQESGEYEDEDGNLGTNISWDKTVGVGASKSFSQSVVVANIPACLHGAIDITIFSCNQIHTFSL
jgi:hypothetical protein